MILAIRTDKPEAELYLCSGEKIIDSTLWHAHRELSDTLLLKIEELLHANNVNKSQLTGTAIYKGPGSFTGLRIGFSVANALAYALNIPITSTSGDDWLKEALVNAPAQTTYGQPVIPDYGSQAHITQPRK